MRVLPAALFLWSVPGHGKGFFQKRKEETGEIIAPASMKEADTQLRWARNVGPNSLDRKTKDPVQREVDQSESITTYKSIRELQNRIKFFRNLASSEQVKVYNAEGDKIVRIDLCAVAYSDIQRELVNPSREKEPSELPIEKTPDLQPLSWMQWASNAVSNVCLLVPPIIPTAAREAVERMVNKTRLHMEETKGNLMRLVFEEVRPYVRHPECELPERPLFEQFLRAIQYFIAENGLRVSPFLTDPDAAFDDFVSNNLYTLQLMLMSPGPKAVRDILLYVVLPPLLQAGTAKDFEWFNHYLIETGKTQTEPICFTEDEWSPTNTENSDSVLWKSFRFAIRQLVALLRPAA